MNYIFKKPDADVKGDVSVGNEPGSTRDRLAAVRARRVVIVICFVMVGFSIATWLPALDVSGFVRLSLNLFLTWFLYKGTNWARIVVGVLAAIGAIVGVLTTLKLGLPTDLVAILIGFFAIYAIIAFVLLSKVFVGPHFEPKPKAG